MPSFRQSNMRGTTKKINKSVVLTCLVLQLRVSSLCAMKVMEHCMSQSHKDFPQLLEYTSRTTSM